MKLDFKKLNYKKLILPAIVLAVFATVFIITPHAAKADAMNTIGSLVVSLLSWVFHLFIYVMGTLLVKAIEILIKILTYNDFINAPIVVKGWTIIRDVCNIAITMVMLLMSFYTIFKNKSYQFQTFLPKLVVAAVAINFSKVFTGFMIDISQVFMMTFVNQFKNAAAGNLTYGFGIEDMLKFGDLAGRGAGAGAVDLSASINNWSIFGGEVLGSLMILVAFVITLSLIVMMLLRILALWFLAVFSPLAFMSGILPGKVDEQWGGMWWGYLNKFLVQGPVVGFMLWLSFAVISEMTASKHIMVLQFQSQISQGNVSATDPGWQAFANKMSGTQNIVDYLVTCGLLIATLWLASKTGIMGSKIAGNFLNKLQGFGDKIIRAPGALGKKVGQATWKASNVPYLASALGGRFATSKTGQFLGLDKEHTAMLDAKRKARWGEWAGGKSGAIRNFQYQRAQAVAKKWQEQGRPDDVTSLRKMLNGARTKEEADAAMLKLAEKGAKGINETDINDYKNKFGAKTAREERDQNEFLYSLSKTQEDKGDTLAGAIFGIERDASGEVRSITKTKYMEDKFGAMKTADFNDIGIIKSFNEEKAEHRVILDKLNEKTDLRSLGQAGRESYAAIVQRTIARIDDLGLNDEEKTEKKKTYTDLYRKLKATRFDRDTGEAITSQNVTKEKFAYLKSQDIKNIEKSGRDDKDIEDITDKAKLDAIRIKYQQGKTEKMREERMRAGEQLTDLDKEIDKNAIKTTLDNDLNGAQRMKMFQAVNNIREKQQLWKRNNNRIAKGRSLLIRRSLSKIEKEVKKNLANSKISIIDPATGQPYPADQLYDKSVFGKNLRETIRQFEDLSTGKDSEYDKLYTNLKEEPDKEKKKKLEDDKKKYLEDLTRKAEILALDFERSAFAGTGKIPIVKDQVALQGGDRDPRILLHGKLLQNKAFNRGRLSKVLNAVERLGSKDLPQNTRVKVVGEIQKNINKALKHTRKWNMDDVFVQKMEDLAAQAASLSANTPKADIDKFKKATEDAQSHVQAK
ncbi:MAG: hypothetical protein PHT40_01980 [Patescibacteria group bacterium]|nr:hypothetical protein [Patescibacteria group bacterium]